LAAEVSETAAIGFYLVYASVAVGLVAYLARTLRRNGAIFLVNAFDDDQLADSINKLLVIGFYLLNLGYAFLLYQLQTSYASITLAFNELVVNLGWLLLSLGVIHLLNMFVFWRIRTHRERGYRRHIPRPISAYAPPPPSPPAPSTIS
jgi:hypothetical protein